GLRGGPRSGGFVRIADENDRTAGGFDERGQFGPAASAHASLGRPRWFDCQRIEAVAQRRPFVCGAQPAIGPIQPQGLPDGCWMRNPRYIAVSRPASLQKTPVL